MVEPKKDKTLTERVVLYWRLMGNSSDGEAEMGMREFRKLRKEGVDIRAIMSAAADWYEQGGKPPNPEENQRAMQEIYDSAYSKGYAEGAETGKRSAILAAAAPMGMFATQSSNKVPVHSNSGINNYTWMQIIEHCVSNSYVFQGNNRKFIEDLPGKLVQYHSLLTSKPNGPGQGQVEYLRDLFMQKFGGRI